MPSVIDIDEYKSARIVRERAEWLSLSDVRSRIELDEAIDQVLYVDDSDDDPHETLPPPPVAPVRSELWQPVRPMKTRWYP